MKKRKEYSPSLWHGFSGYFREPCFDIALNIIIMIAICILMAVCDTSAEFLIFVDHVKLHFFSMFFFYSILASLPTTTYKKLNKRAVKTKDDTKT